MVHRPSDSRLLINLLSQEKEYTKHLSTLLDTAHASLASFSAYASASSPPISTVVLAVAGSFAGADDALSRYMSAVEEWRNRLSALKDLEDEVGNIMRDREIYVNRLIKASKSQKPTRESLLVSLPTTGSTVSLKSEFSLTGKLSVAQADLQACEAHLALKERELDTLRLSTIREGLNLRCKALVECGWAWGEMGKEGLRALEALNELASVQPGALPLPLPPKPADLLPYQQPPSDVSLAPSQSASQTSPDATPKLPIPPAHAIKDLPFPAHVLPRRITEEELRRSNVASTSSEEEADGETAPVQIVENPRFADRQRGKSGSDPDIARGYSIRQQLDASAAGGADADATAKSDVGTGTRDRKMSNAGTGFFGSIRVMFGKKNDGEPESPRKTKWKSRTDKNLKTVKHESDDEGGQFANPAAPMFAEPPPLASPPPPAVRKLRRAHAAPKKKEPAPPVTLTSALEQPEPGVKRAEAWVNGQSKLNEEGTKIVEEGAGEGEKQERAARKARRISTGSTKDKPMVLVKNSHGKLVPSASDPSQSILSRHSSVKSAQSAPNVAMPRRSSSVLDHTPKLKSQTHQRAATFSWAGGEQVESLMSIVEDVEKQNRGERNRSSGGNVLSPVKAPQGKTRRELESETLSPLFVPPTFKSPTPGSSTAPRSSKRSPVAPREIVISTSEQLPAASSSKSPISATPTIPMAPPAVFAQLPIPKAPSPIHIIQVEAWPSVIHQPVPRKPSPKGATSAPLRSALKNTSRSPSPAIRASGALSSAPQNAVASGSGHDRIPSSSSSLSSVVPGSVVEAPPPATIPLSAYVHEEGEGDDTASISSYETGHERFDDADTETEETRGITRDSKPSPPLPPPPPHKLTRTPIGTNANGSTSSVGHRKSVRVSLPPSFSPAPPAVVDYASEEERERIRHREARLNRKMKNGNVNTRARGKERVNEDMWVDSSDEDEEYTRARKMLNRLSIGAVGGRRSSKH